MTFSIPRNELEKRIIATEKYGLTDEEYKKYKDVINKETPYDDVKKILDARGSGINVIVRPPGKLQQKIIELESTIAGKDEELRQCKIDKANILQAKDTCDLINARKIKELEALITGKNKAIDASQADLASARDEIENQKISLRE